MQSTASALDLMLVAPHPDDVELFCGGLAALSVQQGHRVGILDLSRGELSTQGDVVDREREASEAAKVLGIAWRQNLALPDGSIGHESGNLAVSEQLRRLVETVRTARPAVVVAPYWHERHPDHVAASHLVTRAVFLAALPKYVTDSAGATQTGVAPHRVTQMLYYPMRVEAKVSLVVDISGVIEQKRAAIACYRSQIVRLDAGQPTLVSSPLLQSSLDARDGSFGAKIGVSFGEGFIARSPLPVSDPTAFFRAANLNAALSFPEEP